MSFISVIFSRSPNRVGFQTESGLWADRAWYPGERAEYCRNVLHREPYAGES